MDRASQIFAYASILYANSFVHMDQVQGYYEQSWLVQEYKAFSFKMGPTALGTLLDDLGRRTKRVTDYEKNTVFHSSSAIAIDGHAIRICSGENNFGEAGYKYNLLKEDQVNLLMGYGLCAIVQDRLHMDPRRRAVYLFCGKRCDRIKALYWEGFLLLYKRIEAQGRFRWPRDSDEAKQLTWQQFDWLMSGFEIEQPKAFRLPENVDNVPACEEGKL